MRGGLAITPDTIEQSLASSPYVAFLGLVCDDIDGAQGTITLRMPMRPELARGGQRPQFHGGTIAGLIDTAGDLAVALLVGAAIPTIDVRVDYLRPACGDYVTARARARKVGRRVGVADIDVNDALGRLVAIGRGTYSTTAG